jgi:alpha-galactosidase
MPTKETSSMFIRELPEHGGWVLGTEHSLYAIGLGDDGLPVQRYWGPTLPDEDWPRMLGGSAPRWKTSSSRPSEAEDEVLAAGGLRWGAVGLQLEFPDGRNELELRFAGAAVKRAPDEATLTLTLEDRFFPVAVRLRYRVHAGHDVIERWLEVEHGGTPDQQALVRRLDSANWPIPEQDRYRVSSVHGHWGAEDQLVRAELPFGELGFTSRTGTTGHHANPWVMIDDGSADEESGSVWTVTLAWSGSWRMITQRRPEGGVSVTAGAGHEGVTRRLRGGEVIATPPSYGLVADGGFGATSRRLHAFSTRRLRPTVGVLQPVLYNSWEATEFNVTEAGQMALADKAAALGAELFVVDDGWFGRRTHDNAGLGDWYPNPQKFPDGLHALVAHVRSRGMKFGLWVEPEMVNRDSELYAAHPDWVLHFRDLTRRELRNQLVLNFARDDVREWAWGWLSSLVTEYDIDYLKWDMNRPFSQAGWPENTEDPGSLWTGHTEAVYSIMERLRELKPSLLLESCSGGGGRVDLGMMRRVDMFWTSDNTDALDRQPIQSGFSQVYPAATMSNWVTDSPNPISGRQIPLSYRFHVAMAGTLGIGGNLLEWSDEDLRAAEELTAQYKTIRDVVQFGELHRLGGAPGVDLSAVQYVLGDRVVLLAYEPRRSLSSRRRLFRLSGLEPDATYVDEQTGDRFSGRWLMVQGIDLWRGEDTNLRSGTVRFSRADFSSTLITLRRADGAT